MRTPEEVRDALETFERLNQTMEPEGDKAHGELIGVVAALRWMLGDGSGMFTANLTKARHLLRAENARSN